MTYLRDDITYWLQPVAPIERLPNMIRWPAAPGWTLVRKDADGDLHPVVVREGDDEDLIEDLRCEESCCA